MVPEISYFEAFKWIVISNQEIKGIEASLSITLSTAGNSMTSSERPSPEPLLKKEGSPAEGETILEMLWKLQMP